MSGKQGRLELIMVNQIEFGPEPVFYYWIYSDVVLLFNGIAVRPGGLVLIGTDKRKRKNVKFAPNYSVHCG